MQPPDSIHSLIVWIVAGMAFGLGFVVMQWAFDLNSTMGKVVALVVLVVLALLLLLGLV